MKIYMTILAAILCSVSGFSQNYTPPSRSAPLLTKINFSKATEVDAAYRKTFDECDKKGGKNGCIRDPNKLKALLRFGDEALFFQSKMSLDLDGSWVACNCGNNIGKSDQCSTSYTWKSFPADYETDKPKEFCKFYERQDFVDSNKIPYVVIPGGFGNHFKINSKPYGKEFVGDLGVVIYKDKLIPVMVADSGPDFRIGEGSAALLRQLGEERCKKFDGEQCVEFKNYSIDGNVLFFIFPNSKISKDKLSKDNALEMIKAEAMKNFDNFQASSFGK